MRSIDDIYRDMRDEYVLKTGLAVSEGGDMAVRLYTLASQLFTLEVQLDWLKRQSFPQSASGELLDYHAQLRGISRLDGVCARGTIRFAVAQTRNQPVTIPEGTVCISAGGTEFLTEHSAVIAAGALFCETTARARNAGSSGNVPSGSVTYMAQAPAGVSECSNPVPFTGGDEAESDDKLRKRVVDSYKRLPNGTNAAFYENQVMETPGVGAVSVIPRARGRGTVDIYVSSETGLPSPGLLADIEDKLQLVREICVDLSVKAPDPVSVGINLKVQPETGYTFSAAKNDVKNAVESQFDGRLLGKSVLTAFLSSIVYPLPSVKNFVILSPAADVILGPDKLPVLGTLTISEMVV